MQLMADPKWKALTAGFRQTTEAFSKSAGVLQDLEKDKAFWQLFEPLMALPKPATFQAFGSTQEWQVDLAQEMQTNADETNLKNPGSSFKKNLTQRARQRKQFTVMPNEKIRSPEKQQKNNSHEQPSKVSATDKKWTKVEKKNHSSSKPIKGKIPGAWSALEHIEKLTNELQSSENNVSQAPQTKPIKAKPFESTEQIPSRKKDRQEKKPWPLASIQPPKKRIMAYAEEKTAGKRQPNKATKPPPALTKESTQNGDGLALLAQYTTKLWRSSETTQAQRSQRGSTQTDNSPMSATSTQSQTPEQTTPAPRAPSLLATSQQHLATETTEAGTVPGAAQATGTGSPEAETSAPRAERAEDRNKPIDDELDERINRTLIEQAWLRGVDLT